ncbi:MAG: hypothetical protein ABIR68_10175 [Ilumatobacteraceae bacterium]
MSTTRSTVGTVGTVGDDDVGHAFGMGNERAGDAGPSATGSG